jgi:hypothetical protein
MVTLRPLSITLYVHCLPYLYIKNILDYVCIQSWNLLEQRT